MLTCSTWTRRLALAMMLSLVLATCGPIPTAVEKVNTPAVQQTYGEVVAPESTPQAITSQVEAEFVGTPTTQPIGRTGAWLDALIFVEEPSAEAAITRLGAGDMDLYAYPVADPEILGLVQEDRNLVYSESVGSYNELMFNVSGPVLGTGELNPFAKPKIREAMNWLVDRDYIVTEILGGLGIAKYIPITGVFPDYARLADVTRVLEAKYAHDPEEAQEVITREMEALGAERVDGKWFYGGEPVQIRFIIRTEDERHEYGDYVANLLEDLGFTVERLYKTSAEASPLWLRGDPANGEWHLYTGAWISTAISRDQGGNFDFFYTPRGLPFPWWQALTPTPEFEEIADRLKRNDFATLEERAELLARALPLALEDSSHVWLYDQTGFTPRRAEVDVTADLAAGVAGSVLWPYTLRRTGEVGGTMVVGMPSILTESWNPIAGTNWLYDLALIGATGDYAVISDPFTGLNLPQRLESAESYVQEGLPVAGSLAWMSLEYVEENVVPEDAWVDWDAEAQAFLSAGEVYTQQQTAKLRLVCRYRDDLFDTLWHDGSNFSIGDVVMTMILEFDRSKETSSIFDKTTVPAFDSFMTSFKGWRIAQQDPLVVEYYTDVYSMDAENGASNLPCGYPQFSHGPGAWHVLAVGILAEMDGELAFSANKSDLLGIEWMSYVAGPSLNILSTHLDQAAADNYIPYAPTMSQYITAEEAQFRWANYQQWYRQHSHFWVGNGPYFLERALPMEGTVILKRFPDFPDPADKWSAYTTPRIAEVQIDGLDQVSIGNAAAYDVHITFQNEPYAIADIAEVKYLVFDARGELALSGIAQAVEDGLYRVTLSGEQTASLEAGSNRLEVAVVPLVVSIPTFESFRFVASP